VIHIKSNRAERGAKRVFEDGNPQANEIHELQWSCRMKGEAGGLSQAATYGRAAGSCALERVLAAEREIKREQVTLLVQSKQIGAGAAGSCLSCEASQQASKGAAPSAAWAAQGYQIWDTQAGRRAR